MPNIQRLIIGLADYLDRDFSDSIDNLYAYLRVVCGEHHVHCLGNILQPQNILIRPGFPAKPPYWLIFSSLQCVTRQQGFESAQDIFSLFEQTLKTLDELRSGWAVHGQRSVNITRFNNNSIEVLYFVREDHQFLWRIANAFYNIPKSLRACYTCRKDRDYTCCDRKRVGHVVQLTWDRVRRIKVTKSLWLPGNNLGILGFMKIQVQYIHYYSNQNKV